MKNQTVYLLNLLQESFKALIPIYHPVLILSIPIVTQPLLRFVAPKSIENIISFLYYISVWSLFGAARILYVYCRINNVRISILRSLQIAINKFSILLLWRTFQSVVLGASLFPRLFFTTWIIMIENKSMEIIIKQSWGLTKGYGWQIFGLSLALDLISRFIEFFSSLIISVIFRVSIWELDRQFSTNHIPVIVNTLTIIALDLFLIEPLSITIYSLFFSRLINSKKQNPDPLKSQTLAL